MRFMFLQVWADGERDGELLAAVAVVPLGARSHAGTAGMHSYCRSYDNTLGNHRAVI